MAYTNYVIGANSLLCLRDRALNFWIHSDPYLLITVHALQDSFRSWFGWETRTRVARIGSGSGLSGIAMLAALRIRELRAENGHSQCCPCCLSLFFIMATTAFPDTNPSVEILLEQDVEEEVEGPGIVITQEISVAANTESGKNELDGDNVKPEGECEGGLDQQQQSPNIGSPSSAADAADEELQEQLQQLKARSKALDVMFADKLLQGKVAQHAQVKEKRAKD
ncbi:hypothetical protein BT96DRAFT_949755 [Gymnopus androsaceus JB14]|uniref:Uncharacterized protein n=1 Tax=Gymnopus androsaceus JB14 TaxID=1447944 RepID=A0A6A4GJP6_9AGAR|nr:hypothetical protein BT96DRAFT_949755 [Gymnopus androsaceus JB14]